MPRILIIGAGPTGLGAAHRLHEVGHSDFLMVDQNPFYGGLATSFHDDKGFTWDLAVHVAHSHYHYVDRLMDDLLPDGFYYHERRSWVREYGTYIPYPFQNNIRHLPADAQWDCVKGLLDLEDRKRQGTIPEPVTFEDWMHSIFGEGITRHFLHPYNRKIWTVDPSDMGYQWTGDRVPTVDIRRILENIIKEKDDVAWGPNHVFQFPKEGGTGAIWKEMGARVPAPNKRMGLRLTHLDVHEKVATFADGSREPYDALISTMPLIRLTELAGLDAVHQRATQLKYSHVQVVGLAPSFPIPEDLREKTWLYCPEEQTRFYRVTPFSTFSPAHTPDPEKYCSFLCESSTPGHLQPPDEETLIAQTFEGLRESGLVDADPANTHVFMMHAEFGYPIPTVDRDDILEDVIPALEEIGIYSRGRFGGWKYEVANMDHSVMQGVEAVNRILENEPEVTWPTPNVVNVGKR